MTEAELLHKVKASLGITGTYQDETLRPYLDDIRMYMLDAGVSQKTVNSSASVGVISRGVSDLWNYGSGNGKLSEYFIQRVIQLRLRDICNDSDDNNNSDTGDSDINEDIKHGCDVEIDDCFDCSDDSKGEIVSVRDSFYSIELDIEIVLQENWYKDKYYKIGAIENKAYWPISDRILVGTLTANEVEGAKQNFYKLTSTGEILVYSDLNIVSGSTVRCTLSSTYI